MNKFSWIALILFTGPVVHSQTTFERAYGGNHSEHGLSIQQVSDSSFIITGYVETGALSWNLLLLKIDAYGDTVWVKEFTGYPSDAGYSIKNTQDEGGFIIVGCRYCAFATRKIFIVKTDAQGRIRWAKMHEPYDDQIAYDVVLTPVKNYVITGCVKKDYHGLDIYIFKTDRYGNMIWSKSFGLLGEDVGYSLVKANDNGYMITGKTESYAIGSSDLFALKVDESGEYQWLRTFGGADYDEGRSVVQAHNSGFIFAGYTSSFGHPDGDVFVVRTNDTGDTLWTRTYGGPALDKAYSINITNDGGYIITGTTESFGEGMRDVYLLKINDSGDTLWTKTFGGNEYDQGYSVTQTLDGGIIIAGVSSSFTGMYYDVYIIKLDGDGLITWTKEIPLNKVSGLSVYPNPFTSSTTIQYNLNNPCFVKAGLYDMFGNLILELVQENQDKGIHQIAVTKAGLAPGLYFYRVTANEINLSGKLILIN